MALICCYRVHIAKKAVRDLHGFYKASLELKVRASGFEDPGVSGEWLHVCYLEAHTLPDFLGYLVLWLGSVVLKVGALRKG